MGDPWRLLGKLLGGPVWRFVENEHADPFAGKPGNLSNVDCHPNASQLRGLLVTISSLQSFDSHMESGSLNL
jgi:hypothetical protein